jgi:thymidylate synthase
MNTYQTIHEAYLQTLRDVYDNPDFECSPRGQPIREKVDYVFKILNPTSEPIITRDLERNKVIEDYTRKEMELYNSCSNRVEDFAKASKFWQKLANPDGTINSAYGYLIWANRSHGNVDYEMTSQGKDPGRPMRNSDWNTFIKEKDSCSRTPWQWCVEALKSDKDTRQAILRFSLPQHFWIGNKDMTCTLHGNWLIRDDKLHFSVVMRSGDMVKGAVYDWGWFCSLMDKMIEELQPNYPNLTKGHYTHMTHSLHIYEKDEKVVRKMLGM